MCNCSSNEEFLEVEEGKGKSAEGSLSVRVQSPEGHALDSYNVLEAIDCIIPVDASLP